MIKFRFPFTSPEFVLFSCPPGEWSARPGVDVVGPRETDLPRPVSQDVGAGKWSPLAGH